MSQAKNKLPESILVLGVPFRIEVVDQVDEEDDLGSTNGELRLIKIDSSQDTRRRWTTLMHEYVHAVLHVIGVGNKLDDAVEEVIAQSMEHASEQFMKQYGKEYLRALES